MKTIKNTITAILLVIAMLISLSSCLTAVNVAGENVTEEIKDSGTEKTEETEENKETVSSNEGTDAINEPDSSEEEIFMNTDKETGRCPN